MTLRTMLLAMLMIAASLSTAQAKVIEMGLVSRSDVQGACTRAGGQPFGIHDLNGNYGCASSRANISCTVDHVCHALVSDTRPMTGNSLDYLLSGGTSGPAAVMIQPQDRRVVPLKQAQP